MEAHVESIYEQFNARRKALAVAEADAQELFEESANDDLIELQNTLQEKR
jgi:hypothetical protein